MKKTYLHGPMDYATTPKLRFRVDTVPIEKFGGYKTEVIERIEVRERLALRR